MKISKRENNNLKKSFLSHAPGTDSKVPHIYAVDSGPLLLLVT